MESCSPGLAVTWPVPVFEQVQVKDYVDGATLWVCPDALKGSLPPGIAVGIEGWLCMSDGDCPSSNVCRDGACAARCQDFYDDCPAGSGCDHGACVAPCLSSGDDCPAFSQCDSYVCRPFQLKSNCVGGLEKGYFFAFQTILAPGWHGAPGGGCAGGCRCYDTDVCAVTGGGGN
jgi:hypothetical protein